MIAESLAPSPSVAKVMEIAGPENPIDAAGLAQIVFKIHSEYADEMVNSLRLEETSNQHRVQEWLDDVQTLFGPSLMQSLSKSPDTPPPRLQRLAVLWYMAMSVMSPAELWRIWLSMRSLRTFTERTLRVTYLSLPRIKLVKWCQLKEASYEC